MASGTSRTSWTRSSVRRRSAGRARAPAGARTRDPHRGRAGRGGLGTTKDIQVDTASSATPATARARPPARRPRRGHVPRPRRGLAGHPVLPGPGHDLAPLPAVPGLRHRGPGPRAPSAGDGRVRSRRTLTVKIPAGVDNGTRIQLAGEGEVGPGGGPAGDLYVEIHELPHSTFQRRGDDLHCTVTIPMTAAALGTKVPLETLDGMEEVDIRPGTQSGQSIPLHGRGVTHLRGGGRGDLIVHVEVTTPSKLDPEQGTPAARAGRAAWRGAPDGTVPARAAGALLAAEGCLQRALTWWSRGLVPARRRGAGGSAGVRG
ncbi:hypothetical protein LV779_28535 [Streptomyces thinghirensis]|nr:hypothetical protein [Streptomyces thinghirensis]